MGLDIARAITEAHGGNISATSEPGKEATLFSATGDILDIRSDVTHFWFVGKEISLENRHTRLYQKYKNRPNAQ